MKLYCILALQCLAQSTATCAAALGLLPKLLTRTEQTLELKSYDK